jgi:surface polysaccharide O-acyltransferase-like enzyme
MWLNSEKTRKLRENLASLFSKPMAILLLIIPYGFIYLIELLDDKNPIAYFYVVIVGFLFASDEKYMQALIRDRRKYYFLTIILYIIFFKCAPSSEANMMVTYFYEYLALTLKMVSSISLLILFNRHINKNTKILKYLSKSSFTVYVVHMLILTAVSFAVVRFAVPPVVKFFIMVIVSYIISFAVYELLKRTLFQLPFLKSNAGR